MPFERKFPHKEAFPIAAHPGHMIIEYFDFEPANNLPAIIGCSQEHFNRLITFDVTVGLSRIMCLRLAHYFKTSYEFWYNIQEQYDIALLSVQEQTIVLDLYQED